MALGCYNITYNPTEKLPKKTSFTTFPPEKTLNFRKTTHPAQFLLGFTPFYNTYMRVVKSLNLTFLTRDVKLFAGYYRGISVIQCWIFITMVIDCCYFILTLIVNLSQYEIYRRNCHVFVFLVIQIWGRF